MPEYSIFVSKAAQKQLDKLDNRTAAPLLEAIAGLAANHDPAAIKN